MPECSSYTTLYYSGTESFKLDLSRHCKSMQRIKPIVADARVSGYEGCPRVSLSLNRFLKAISPFKCST